MKKLFTALFFLCALAVLTVAALPAQTVAALGPDGTPTPTGTPNPAQVNARLEKIFARQQNIVARMSLSQESMVRFETLIARAEKAGQDVTSLKTALASLKNARETTQPLRDQAQTLVTARAGFDTNGKVVDAEAARQTVKSLAEILKQVRQSVGPAAKAWREAAKAFRQAHPLPQPTSQP